MTITVVYIIGFVITYAVTSSANNHQSIEDPLSPALLALLWPVVWIAVAAFGLWVTADYVFNMGRGR